MRRWSEAVRFDERGLVPCVLQDWRTGEVLTLAYMNEEALRLTRETGEIHFYSRSRAASSGTRARPRATSSACASCATTATATRSSRWSSPPAPPATPASAPASTATSRAAPTAPDGPPVPASPSRRPTRRCRARADAAARQRERPEGCYTVELLDDPAADRREGARGGRRGRPRGRRRVGGAGRRGGRRRPLPPRGAAALPRRLAGRGAGGAQ